MAITTNGGTHTLTGGASGSRLTPQEFIDNVPNCTLAGNKTIVVSGGDHIVIDGFYDDSGWHYEMSSGSRMMKGASCDWVSGQEIYGFKISGASWSIDNLGHSWNFNLVDGGSVYWRDVYMETRSSGRSDINFTGDTTNYDIDGFYFVSPKGSLENTQTVFNTGSMKNISFIRTNHAVGGTGVIENFNHSGLLENGAENKIFPFDDNYRFVKYTPFLNSDGKKVATGFHTFTSSDGEKTIYFDDLVAPSFFDHTTDIVAFSGPGRLIGSRTFKLNLFDAAGAALPATSVLLRNKVDNTSSIFGQFNVVDQLVVVYDGQKTGGGSYSIPNVRLDYQVKDLFAYKYGYKVNAVLDINMAARGYDSALFMLSDTSIVSTKVAALARTTLNTPLHVYEYDAAWLEDNFEARQSLVGNIEGSILNVGSFNVVIDPNLGSPRGFDGTTLSIKSNSFSGNIKTTGNVEIKTGVTYSGQITASNINIADGVDITGSTFNGAVSLNAGRDLTNITVVGGLTFNDNTPATYTMTGSNIDVLSNTGSGLLTWVQTGSTVSDFTDAEVNIVGAPVEIRASGLPDGARVQLYNVTTSTEINNSVVSGGYSFVVGGEASDGDTLRLRVTFASGVTAKKPAETLAQFSSASGAAFLVTLEDDEIYNGFAVDGSTITQFAADYINNELDVQIGSNFNVSDLYSWYVYNLTTEQGIRLFYGTVTAVDAANFRINSGVLNVKIDNTTNTNIRQNDNRRIFRSDESYPVKDPTSGGGGVDIVWRNKIFITETGTSGLTPGESAKLEQLTNDVSLARDHARAANIQTKK